jgi:lysozyme family protein
MADWNLAYARLSNNEGGYVNHPSDGGGETYRGVARKYHPDWEGWARIDSMKKRGAKKAELDADPALWTMVKEFFRKRYWLSFASIENQAIATILFDWAVLTRPALAWDYAKAANKKAVNAAAINRLTPSEAEKFFNRFKEIREAHHRRRVAEKTDQEVFLDGWLSRNDKFVYTSPKESRSWWPLGVGVAAGALAIVITKRYLP